MKSMSGRNRSAVSTMVAGFCLWLGAAGTALAADQWWDISNASGLTAGSNNWSTSVSSWAGSASPGTANPGVWTNGNNAFFAVSGTSTVVVDGVIANLLNFSAGTYYFLPGLGALTINGGLSNTALTVTFNNDIVLGNPQTWYQNSGTMTVTGLVSGAELTKAGRDTLVLSNAANSFVGLKVNNGTLTAYAPNGGTVLGTGPLTLGTVVPLTPGVSLAQLNLNGGAVNTTTTIGDLTNSDSAALAINGTNTLAGANLARTGAGTLRIQPQDTLGNQQRMTFTGGVTPVNGMLGPWLVDAGASGSGVGTFVTYGANGLTDVVYNTGGWDATKIIDAGSPTLNQNTNVYALRLSSQTVTVNPGIVLSNASGGLIMNYGTLTGAGTVEFGSREALIFNSSACTISANLSGTGALTKFGGGTLTINNANLWPGSSINLNGFWANNGGVLTLSPTADVTLKCSIAGLGPLTKDGGNTLTCTGTTFAVGGLLTVKNGTLSVYPSGAQTTQPVNEVDVGPTAGLISTLNLSNANLRFAGAGAYALKLGLVAGANSNTVNVLAGTVWDGGGGKHLTIGTVAGTTGNVLRVDGSGTSGGAVVSNFLTTAMFAGVGGQMILTNGAWTYFGCQSFGGISNQIVVVGPGTNAPGVTTKWDYSGVGLGIAANANGNTLRVDGAGVYGGAIVTNAGATSAGAGSIGNVINVVNGGWLFMNFNAANGTSNHLNVGSAGMTSRWDCGQNWAAGDNCKGNIVTITNAIVNGSLALGNPTTSGNASNGISVLANTLWNYNGGGLAISYQNGGAQLGPVGNWYAVNGGIVSNVAGVQIAGTASSLSISNNGQLLATSLAFATGDKTTNATVTLASGGLLEVASSGLSVNTTGGGSTITNSGGIYQFTSATPTITTNGVPGGSIFINSGTISFRGVPASAPVNLTNNWGGINLARLTWNGNNALRLNNSIATNSCAGGYTFNTGLGATNYYCLEMINGTTKILGKGITIGGTGSVLFSNTTATIGGAFTNNGTMTVVDSLVTFATNCVLDGGSLVMSTNAASSNLVSVAGSLTTSGTIALDVTGLVAGKPSQVTLFNVTGAFTDNATWSVTPSSYKVQKQGQNLVLGRITSGMVIIIR